MYTWLLLYTQLVSRDLRENVDLMQKLIDRDCSPICCSYNEVRAIPEMNILLKVFSGGWQTASSIKLLGAKIIEEKRFEHYVIIASFTSTEHILQYIGIVASIWRFLNPWWFRIDYIYSLVSAHFFDLIVRARTSGSREKVFTVKICGRQYYTQCLSVTRELRRISIAKVNVRSANKGRLFAIKIYNLYTRYVYTNI